MYVLEGEIKIDNVDGKAPQPRSAGHLLHAITRVCQAERCIGPFALTLS